MDVPGCGAVETTAPVPADVEHPAIVIGGGPSGLRGAAWTPEPKEAWVAAYNILSNFMIGAAYSRPQAAE